MRLSGKMRFRQTWRGKLILQVQEVWRGFDGQMMESFAASRWRDASGADLIGASMQIGASVDTRPKDEDALAASLASGAVPNEDSADAQTSSPKDPQ